MKINFNRIIIPSEKDKIISLFTQFIQCKICMNILNDPIDCICCNQTFCRSCIQNYIKANNKCPYQDFFSKNNQKKKSILENLKPSSINFSRFIQSLKFCCKNTKNGCNEALSIEEISEHDKVCKYKKITHINSKNNFLIDDSDIFINLSNCEGKNHNNYFSLFKEQMNKKKKAEPNNIKINYNQDNSSVSFKPIESNNQNSCVNTNSNTNSNNNSHFNLNNYENINNYYSSTPYFKQSNFYSNEKIYKLIEEINSKINTFIDDQKKNDINFDKYKLNLNNDTYIKTESESTRFTSSVFKEKNECYNSNLYKENSSNKESIKIRNHKSTCNFDYNLKKNKSICSANEINFKNNSSNEKIKIIKNMKPNDNVNEDNKTERKSESVILTEGNNIKSTPKLRIKVIPKSKRKKNMNLNSNSNEDKNKNNNNAIINENEITSLDLYKEIINYMKKLDEKIINIENLLQNKERVNSVKSLNLDKEENNNKKIKNNIYSNNNYISQKNLIKKEKNKTSKTVYEEPLADITKNKNDDLRKTIKELFQNIENNFNAKISDKFNEFQKYLGDNCMNDIRNAILDVNLDVMNLYTEKFENIENILTNTNIKKTKNNI